MSALSASPSDVKHPESLADVVPFPGSGKVRPLRQGLDGFGQGIGIDMRLPFAEMLGGPTQNIPIGVCTSLPTTPHLVVGRSACRVGVGPSLNRSWAQRSRPVVQAGRRAFPGDESVVD